MINRFDETKPFDYENGFYLTSKPARIGNILAHYELYKMIKDLPGNLVELGVFKGGSLIQFATFRELLENEGSRKIIGFDIFGEFPEATTVESDKNFIEKFAKLETKGEFLTREELLKSFENKGIGNIELIQGDIRETVPFYVKNHPELRISLLHIDTDVYEPAKVGLEELYDRVVKGGVIVFDDFATVEGETIAIEEFFRDKDYIIKKMSLSHTKPSYIIRK